MLYVLSEKSKIDKDNFIFDVDIYFDRTFNDFGTLEPDPIVNKILKEIDGAKIIEKGIVETKFGVARIPNLSSGCKALLIAAKNPDIIVNFTEAGKNVLRLAVELSQDIDIHIFTQNKIVFGGFNDVIVNVNGEEMTVNEWIKRSITGRL